MSINLNLDKALIFRIVHRDNLPWILDHGLHCRNSGIFDPNYVNIGNPELIDKRHHRVVSVPPGGTLSDYVPFYFTPYSPMLYNIKTGWAGIRQRTNDEIVILVSSLRRLAELGLPFLFSDRHAYLTSAQFSSDMADLIRIDWPILQRRDFKRDVEDPGKVERYQAEALVYGRLPVEALIGVGCHTDIVATRVRVLCDQRALNLRVVTSPSWYF
ncbi:type II toxin-antitoxin system toxin DNA ADP-ribosyl transferase DarT [Nevskia soli]|uniref:type II toxin-antitoxin system toxin DNA ADP-ribosyl transferase DarT n=1 Tax=Nevskia soli TaxID=418856 RepID=UPI0009FC86EE|nr:DUF4433 domain-containing protein [Nevskia soli]